MTPVQAICIPRPFEFVTRRSATLPGACSEIKDIKDLVYQPCACFEEKEPQPQVFKKETALYHSRTHHRELKLCLKMLMHIAQYIMEDPIGAESAINDDLLNTTYSKFCTCLEGVSNLVPTVATVHQSIVVCERKP